MSVMQKVNLHGVEEFDPYAARRQFPILSRQVNGRPLVYLDSAASAQKPRAVIEALTERMSGSYANVHRGLHTLANETTEAYEAARESVARYLNARSSSEIVFTKGGTEAINLVAASLGLTFAAGDEVVLTEMEHHSNIVPWQVLCRERGAELRYLEVDERGELSLQALEAELARGDVRLAAFAHVSNVLGTINPVAEMVARVRAAGAVSLIDGAQAVPHMPVDLSLIHI